MNSSQSIWAAAEKAVVAADVSALDQLLHDHAEVLRKGPAHSSWCGGLTPNLHAGDARSILAREHRFDSYAELANHLDRIKKGELPLAAFEAAADAIVSGDAGKLRQLLHQHPALSRQRSTRNHRATLLHYTGANGVESWRQKTPPNIALIVEILLQAGSEIDALGDMYGGSTTLGLAATSVHPFTAGVQNALMEILIQHGAAIDHPRGAGNGQRIVNGCLANGRPGAAEFLARRGARLDLEGASGVGDLEKVRSFFDMEGRLRESASQEPMKSGFQWACQYGRTDVVRFLMAHGARAGEIHRGQTGLHWVSYAGHFEIAQLLLNQRPPIDLKDESFAKTPLGWALYGWANPPMEAGGSRYHEIVAALVGAGAVVEPRCLSDARVTRDPRMVKALQGGTMLDFPCRMNYS